ncbi:Zinc finger CCHC-type protein [Dioscorea alata]|uniref:Zinc finger CCHC-type protein n=1 Tax=Dioscorea alata TaxID=55571 RepID=A0ACB7VRZ5_DIOAL|nr:Zinc finger CCHC-type protein [Dioscorea alata]
MRFLGGDRESHGGPRRSYGGGRGGRRFGSQQEPRPFTAHPRPLSEPHLGIPPTPPENIPIPNKCSPVKEGIPFAEVVRTSPPLDAARTNSGSTSLKRRRSQENEVVCKRCLRPGHAVEDCRHQLTCRRCSGVGHYAARCPLKASKPKSSEKTGSRKSKSPPSNPKTLLHVPVSRIKSSESHSVRVSLPITEAIIQSKEDLKRRVIIKVTAGNASVRSLHAALPKRLKTDQCENITPFGDDFILTLFSAKAASAIVKLNSLSLETNHGPCSITFSHWTPEFGSHAVATGNYNWIRLSNLPLHCWNWDSIVAVLKPLGDLIFVRKCEDVSLEHMKALVRLKSPIAFPLTLTVDIGVRSFLVRLEDDGAPIIRSKIIHGAAAASNPQRSSNTSDSPSAIISQPQTIAAGVPHRLSREEKGKFPISHSRSAGASSVADHPLSEIGPVKTSVILNSDDQPLPEVGRSSDDQSAVLSRIPPISSVRTGEGDVLFMHSIDVSAERTTLVDLPRDQLSIDPIGTMHLSNVPRDSHYDSLNYSNLISSHTKADNLETLPCDEIIPDQQLIHSSNDLSQPRDMIKPDSSINPSIKRILSRDEHSTINAPTDPTHPISSQIGLTISDPTHANSPQLNPEIPKDNLLASNNSPPSPGIKLGSKDTGNPLSSQSNSLEKDDLPTHLRLLPPTIPIPEGYKWIFIHGG